MGKKTRTASSPATEAAVDTDLQQRQKEQSSGDYNWVELFKLEQKWLAATPALPKDASLPVASFCDQRVEVREIPGRGRGLTLSAPAAEGELLFACRAFAIAPRSELQAAVVEQLRRCPEASYKRFLCLQSSASPPAAKIEGSIQDWTADTSSKPSKPRTVDAELVGKVLRHNSIARDALDARGSAGEAPLSGLWLLPSLVNHCCRPNVHQSFLGDLLIARAARPMAAGEELMVAYVSTLQPRHVRTQHLAEVFDFDCRCSRCTLEAALLSTEKAKKLLEDLDATVAGAPGRPLPELGNSLDELCKRAQREVSAATATGLEQIGSGNRDLIEASCRLWGKPADSNRKNMEDLLCGSFLAVFMGSAFARKQLKDSSKAAEAYASCVDLLAAVCPGSAYHAHWSLEWVLQASAAGDKAINRIAGRALRWCRAFAGADPAVFRLLALKLGWTQKLVDLAESSPELPEELPKEELPADIEESNDVWDYSLDEGENAFMLTISLPEGLGPADVDLDVAPERVSLVAGAPAAPLAVMLPRKVDPAAAPPAKYKRKGNRLILELPFA
eukprot:TRINITY_DN65394_c0_g1_i1.p1 TRINITY_DN65394_c0_g1~~TRINITY_DN65394_c0_g1_i1.p1  ORF type:complete len:568 (+),score=150.33 TRINITY_DN65394_c0_g1_i1:27-1706(+)